MKKKVYILDSYALLAYFFLSSDTAVFRRCFLRRRWTLSST